MSARVWRKGPPPHVGWWNASNRQAEIIWRWWDGQCWSYPANEDFSRKQATYGAKIPDGNGYEVEWTDYYPERARVPRIDPTKEINK